MSNAIKKALAGLLIGIGCVLPGVSGGVMAVSFGLYKPMIDALLGFFRKPKENFRFLLPILLGGAPGFYIGAAALGFFMERYEAELLFLFIGFIIGGVRQILKQANKNGFKPRFLIALALGIAPALALTLIPATGEQQSSLNTLQSVAIGGIQGISTVIPGISGSFLLIYLGWYQAYLGAVSALDFGVLIPLALGFAASALICMKGIKWLFDRFPAYAEYAVLGFLLVSTYLIVPPIGSGAEPIVRLLLLAAGILAALWIDKAELGVQPAKQ